MNSRSWFREHYYKVVNSIAFYPAIIALLFLVLSAASIAFDFSEEGKEIKLRLQWLRLKDASTARSIIASISAGILSLTVFSFSMVMIVLSQTASQMSNRILDKLIGSRFQQVVLGIYVGTIVYALFLLSTIRDVDSGIHIPALSSYLLITLTICDIFLFIYFLHYITQSVKYDVIIRRIYDETLESMKKTSRSGSQESDRVRNNTSGHSIILAGKSGIYEGFHEKKVIELCDHHDCIISILHTPGTFLIEGTPLAEINSRLSDQDKYDFQSELFIHSTESIKENFIYGFKQLTEVGIKALSPGINDPGTAIQSLRALFELYSYRVCHFTDGSICNTDNIIRIRRCTLSFPMIFETTLLPIWDYGKNDRMIRHELKSLLSQLALRSPDASVAHLLKEVNLTLNEEPV